MLSAFVKDESGGVAIAYGMVVLTAAIVSLAGMVGSVMTISDVGGDWDRVQAIAGNRS